MKAIWVCAALLLILARTGFGPTTDELVNDAKNNENVTTQSMGVRPKEITVHSSRT